MSHDIEQYICRYGAWIHTYFESTRLRHIHQISKAHYLCGDGATVLRVIKPHGRHRGGVWKIEPHRYADYFLPEELE